MKCEDVSKELIPYLDRRSNSADRHEVEEHLAICVACRTRAEELRTLWSVLDEVPIVEPSLGFDARMRARIAEEPQPRWYPLVCAATAAGHGYGSAAGGERLDHAPTAR